MDRGSSRADVLVTCADGTELAWEVQMSPIQARQVLRRSHNAVRQGRLPSWLTTDRRAGSPTRALINRAPWSMVSQIVPEQIRAGRAARVLGGLRNFAWRRCIELPGRCPLSTGVGGWSYDCGDWHGIWEKVTVPVEEFVGKTAAGLYVPIAIPGADGAGVMRLWGRPQDHDAYAEQHGHRFTEQDLPEKLRIGPPPASAPRPREGAGPRTRTCTPLRRPRPAVPDAQAPVRWSRRRCTWQKRCACRC